MTLDPEHISQTLLVHFHVKVGSSIIGQFFWSAHLEYQFAQEHYNKLNYVIQQRKHDILSHSHLVVQIGKSKVFLRAGQMAELDAHRSQVLGKSACTVQRKYRSYLARKRFISLCISAVHIQTVCRGTDWFLI